MKIRGYIGRLCFLVTVLLLGSVISVLLATVGLSTAPAKTNSSTAPPPASSLRFKLSRATPSRLSGATAEGLLAEISTEHTRQRAIKRILSASSSDALPLHRLLHRRTDVSAGGYKSLLRTIGAQVPDHRGRFSVAAKQVDWLEELISKERASLSPRSRKALDQSTLTVALIRALAATRHHDAAISLLRFAYRHKGAFRDECGRAIRSMGTAAVPGLVRAQVLNDPLAYRMKRYAGYQLDRMDFTRADRALEAADATLKTELLHAYGEVRDPSAVNGVLGQVNADNPTVREAARWAMLRYVSGRPPKVIKRRLKLAGGRFTEKARSLYLTYRQLARHAIVERLGEEQAAKGGTDEERETRFLAEQLFKLLDKRRQRAHERQVQRALEMAGAGRLDEALKNFDQMLIRDPFHQLRAKMAPFYLQRGTQLLREEKLRQAARLFTKAIHLAGKGSLARTARARRALAEALASPKEDQLWRLRAALMHDPELGAAKEALRRAERGQERRVVVVGAVGGGVSLSLIIGLLFLRRRIL